jgi:hypothetical protein
MLEEAWCAIMHTVLLNTDFQPLLKDRFLKNGITKFKIWFLEFALKGKVINGPKRKYVVLHQWDKLLSGLKTIAAWFQFYALDSNLNIRPPSMPWFYGWVGNHPTFPWFKGHLRHWQVIEGKPLSDLSIRTLCQIRTFGRALPPPSMKMCIEDLKTQVKVLTTPNIVSNDALRTCEYVSDLISEKLGASQLPKDTHISVSTSGCFEVTGENGGLARYVQNWVKELESPIGDVRILHDGELFDFVEHYTANTVDTYFDVYSSRMFPRRNFLFLDSPTLLDCLYRQSGAQRRKDANIELLGKDLLSPEVGAAILLMASSEAILQGYYVNLKGERSPPDMHLVLPSGRKIPIWKEFITLRYISTEFPKTELQCLAEPGAKTRSLGKSQAWFTIVTKVMRFMAEPILARDGRSRIGLRSTNKMWSFLKYLSRTNYEEKFLQSTDFRAATDYIALLMLKSMWKPFCSRVPEKHPFLVYQELIWCRRSLHFSDKFSECRPTGQFSHECGSFMGEPMSFMSLTLINLVIEETNSYYFRNNLPLFQGIPRLLSGDPLCICGDDVAALRNNLEIILRFKQTVAAYGMKLSWKDGISRRVLIFCEDHVLLDENGKFVYLDVIKSRLLTTMARQHSENRSSILGKGRMLTNQLDYFDDKNIKIFVMEIYHTIFDRAYNYMLGSLALPHFLPPSCGGMGYPIEDSKLPPWAYEYIGYIFDVLKEEDIMSRYSRTLEFSLLNKRNKHGIDNSEKILSTFKAIANANGEPFRFFTGKIPETLKPREIYNTDVVVSILEKFNLDIPKDPYTGGPDYDSVRNESQRFGLVPLREIFDQIERTLNFQEFLKDDLVLRSQRTFEQWVRSSGKFWNKALYRASNSKRAYYVQLGREKFTSLNNLDRIVQRSYDGYVYPSNWISPASAGPSLKIDFRVLRRTPLKRFFKTGAEVPISLLLSQEEDPEISMV